MKYLFFIVIFSFLFFTTTLAQERKHSTFMNKEPVYLKFSRPIHKILYF